MQEQENINNNTTNKATPQQTVKGDYIDFEEIK
jgi:hypothetical protein